MNPESKVEPIIDARSLEAIGKAIEDSKAEDELARQELTPDEERAVIRRVLQGQYGPDTDPRTIDAAVDAWFDKRFEFEPPDGPSLFDTLYIRRGAIALWTIMPLAVLALVLGVVHRADMARAERETAAQVATARSSLQKVLRVSKEVLSELDSAEDKAAKALPAGELADARRQAAEARATLDELSAALEKKSAAIPADLAGARRQTDEANATLASVRETARQLVLRADRARTAVAARASLDSLIGEIRAAKPAAGILERAEKAYGMGIASLDGGRVEDARRRIEDIEEVRSDLTELNRLGPELERLHASIGAIVREEPAKASAEDIWREGQANLQAGDLPRLKDTVGRLARMERELNLEYDIVVTGGVERTKDDNPGVKYTYLVVEARDQNGKVIPRRIVSEEDASGKPAEVREWAERVPRTVFERVKADKRDNGRIDEPGNRLFGKKERGWLSETVVMQDGGQLLPRAGRIIRY